MRKSYWKARALAAESEIVRLTTIAVPRPQRQPTRGDRKTGLIMALSGIYEHGFSPGREAEYRAELDYIEASVDNPPEVS